MLQSECYEVVNRCKRYRFPQALPAVQRARFYSPDSLEDYATKLNPFVPRNTVLGGILIFARKAMLLRFHEEGSQAYMRALFRRVAELCVVTDSSYGLYIRRVLYYLRNSSSVF